MPKYLWELDIESIPLGWQETYDFAVSTCPHGEIIGMPNIDSERIEINRYFYHPVGYREKLVSLFNQEKRKAIDLVKVKDEIDFKDFLNELLKIDIKLFNLLYDWLSEDDVFDGSTLDPKTIEKDVTNSSDYFSFDADDFHHPESFAKYLTLKLLDLSN